MLISQVSVIYWTLKELSDEGISGLSLEGLANEISIRHSDLESIRCLSLEGDLSLLACRINDLSCVENIEGNYHITNNRPFSNDPIIDAVIKSVYAARQYKDMPKKITGD